MWGQVQKNLEPELRAILSEQAKPQTVEQIVQHLFYRRQQFSELLILSRASIKEKQKLKRAIERCLERGIATKSWLNGQAVYALDSGVSTRKESSPETRWPVLEAWIRPFRRS